MTGSIRPFKNKQQQYLRQKLIEERVLRVANYTVKNKSTIRQTAEVFNTSKSTVHKDLVDRLPYIDTILSKKAAEVLRINKIESTTRGGAATKNKWKQS